MSKLNRERMRRLSSFSANNDFESGVSAASFTCHFLNHRKGYVLADTAGRR